jgi:hypothetical protein
MDGGAAGGRSVLNARNTPYDDLNLTAQVHEWLHVLHAVIWDRGGFDWMQCLPLHDQLRDLRLEAAWRTGRLVPQQEVFVDAMQRYVTARMWKSIENRKSTGGEDSTKSYD